MKAVFWDLDDTVLNTLPGRVEALAATVEEFLGTRPDARQLWSAHLGVTLEGLARELLDEDWPRFVQRYRERYYGAEPELEAFPGVVEVLNLLRSDGLQLAIVTSKVSWGARGELERAGLLGHFETVVGWDDRGRPKPAPDPLLLAMERLGLTAPAEIAYVGRLPDRRPGRARGRLPRDRGELGRVERRAAAGRGARPAGRAPLPGAGVRAAGGAGKPLTPGRSGPAGLGYPAEAEPPPPRVYAPGAR